jgi:hypothetical protein
MGTQSEAPIVFTAEDVERAHPWDQREGELTEHYKMFRAYLDQEREDRSLSQAEILWRDRGGEGRSQNFYRTAQENDWKRRALAYDRFLDAKVMERLANRRLAALSEMAHFGRAMRDKAQAALDALDSIVTTEVTDPETGQKRKVQKSALNASEIARLAQMGTEIEQLALGAPTARTSVVAGALHGGGDTTADAMSESKRLLLAKIENIRKRRRLANAASDARDDGTVDDSEALEYSTDAEPGRSDRERALESEDEEHDGLDYEVVIEREGPSPEEARLAMIERLKPPAPPEIAEDERDDAPVIAPRSRPVGQKSRSTNTSRVSADRRDKPSAKKRKR